MWKRAELKEKAKAILSQTYWQAFGVAVIAAVLSFDIFYLIQNFKQLLHWFISFSPISQGLLVWVNIAAIVIGFFVANVVQVGTKHFFIRNRDGETNIGNLFHGFKHGYWNIVDVQFMTGLIITLWALLLIIPGIIAGYKYSMVPYLLSENPEINGVQARKLSAEMTDGQKLNIFELDLSFYGWLLAGTICFGIGKIFVIPYVEATKAELYITLRDRLDSTLPPQIEKEENEYASVEHSPVEPK